MDRIQSSMYASIISWFIGLHGSGLSIHHAYTLMAEEQFDARMDREEPRALMTSLETRIESKRGYARERRG